MLEICPDNRISASEALLHDFFCEEKNSDSLSEEGELEYKQPDIKIYFENYKLTTFVKENGFDS